MVQALTWVSGFPKARPRQPADKDRSAGPARAALPRARGGRCGLCRRILRLRLVALRDLGEASTGVMVAIFVGLYFAAEHGSPACGRVLHAPSMTDDDVALVTAIRNGSELAFNTARRSTPAGSPDVPPATPRKRR